MNIEDYRILTGASKAYIGRPARWGQLMLESRREITEDEILNLIAWWLNKKLEGTENESISISKNGERIVELKRLKKYDI